jgi:hypothetical protein
MVQKTLPESTESQYKRLLLRQWADLGVMVVPSGESEVKK